MIHSNVPLTVFSPYKTVTSAAYVVVVFVLLDITFSLFKLRADNDAPPQTVVNEKKKQQMWMK